MVDKLTVECLISVSEFKEVDIYIVIGVILRN